MKLSYVRFLEYSQNFIQKKKKRNIFAWGSNSFASCTPKSYAIGYTSTIDGKNSLTVDIILCMAYIFNNSYQSSKNTP